MKVNSRAKGKLGGTSSSNSFRFGAGRVTDPPENNGEESDFEPPGPKLNSSFSVNKLVMYQDILESGAHKTLHGMIPQISDFNYETTRNIINEDRPNITEQNAEMFGKFKTSW
uniref:Uncharacterized protein n=1 Tax=Arundo donax TaxID=35708 RepID=A0A0A9EPW2_ARUDO